MKKYELYANEDNIKETIKRNSIGRNSKLVMLGKMLANLDENVILSIDGNWGSGKTFFVKQFEYLIKNIERFEGNNVFVENDKEVFKKLKAESIIVYYNAWENDNHDEPFESIMYKILNDFPKQKNQLVDFKELKKVLKEVLNDFIKTVSHEHLNINFFEKMEDYSDLTSNIVTIEEKKDNFNKLINKILSDNQRLILIIDELDRCKPTFAVKLLETIKHFYNNDNITILVSTNNKELAHTIKKFYGNDFDGYGYLDKFYDCVINLECLDIKQYLQKELEFGQSTYIYHDFAYLILKYYRFSLRECNKFVTIYNLLKNYIEHKSTFNTNENYIVTSLLIPLAIALKIKDINKYQDFINNNGQQEITRLLEKMFDNDFEIKNWIKELFKDSDLDYKVNVISCYENVISGKHDIYLTPFFEDISMLGTKINIESGN